MLDAINSGMVPKFADGGYVGRAGSRGLMGSKAGGTTINMGDVNIQQSGSSGNPQKDAEHARQTAQLVRDAVRAEIADWYMQERRAGGMIYEDAM